MSGQASFTNSWVPVCVNCTMATALSYGLPKLSRQIQPLAPFTRSGPWSFDQTAPTSSMSGRVLLLALARLMPVTAVAIPSYAMIA